ncbi:MAG: phosphodiester glycosidase family protein [Oscillospiraceae bacterium]|nr:phosphodiester glycosidase family protein [Oscillospiraceae bacterium]
MKRKLLRAGTSLLIILVLLASTAVYAMGTAVYTNTRWLADNLQYINTITWLGSPGRAESFQLRMTGPGDAFPIVMTGDTVANPSRISEIVAHAESLGFNVLAAINSDFFSMQTGVPMGIVIENGIYKSSSTGRPAVAFDNNGGVFFIPSPHVQITLTNNGSHYGYNLGRTWSLYHFNKSRADTGGMYMYSEAFSGGTTRASSPGWSVRFRILYGVPTVSGEMMLEVVDKIQSDGDMYIGQGYMVLTAADESGWGEVFYSFAIGDTVTMTTTPNDERLAQAQFATGAGDIIVANGMRTDYNEWDQAIRARAPRTAFGIRADGSIISLVVDGRNSPYSVGMTKDELADEFIRLGAVHAVNFDGGGSSAISVRLPGERYSRVISRPSDGVERRCSTYILFVTNARSDGFAQNLHLTNDGVIVLTGSDVELTFTATDGGYMPVAVPHDITATADGFHSIVNGTQVTAGGSIVGPEIVTLYSPSTGAQGVGEIFVITDPTSIIVTRKGYAPRLSSVTLQPGELFEFDVRATFYRRDVISQMGAFTYTVDGDIGELIEPGLFIAGETLGQRGTITVSAGNRHEVITVEIGGIFEDMQDHWARGYVEYLFNAGVVTGITPTTYGPDREIRRGDFVLMLHRAAGKPIPGRMSGFEDVPIDVYFADAVAWAREMGIAHGVGDNRFNPQATLTRQEAFTFVYRALGILDIEVPDDAVADLTEFTDAGSIAEFARTPTAMLVGLGVVGGSNGRLMPEASLTRAQMARVLASVLWI